MTPPWNRWITLALPVVSVVLTLAALEVVFRVAGIRAEYHRPRVDQGFTNADVLDRVPHGFVPFATIISTYDSDPRGYFEPGNRISHRFNSAGWRDTEHPVEKSPRTYRILGLGDSYLYGQGVRFEDICLTRLGKRLQERARGVTIECINTGMSAMNTAEERELLTHRGLRYEPDLVILHFVPNDVEPDVLRPGPKVEFFVDYVATYQKPDALSKYSHLWSWARQRYLRAVLGRRYLEESLRSFEPGSPKWSECARAIDDIHHALSARGVPLVVVIFPFLVDLSGDYPFQRVHDVVRAHCASQGIPCLDLRGAYRGHEGPELWVHPSDPHPNEIAHDLAARAMAEYLEAHPEVFRVADSSRGAR